MSKIKNGGLDQYGAKPFEPGPATGGELDAACIQFDLGGETIPPLTWLHYNHWLHYLQPFIMDRISQK